MNIDVCKELDPNYIFRLRHHYLEANWKMLLSNGEVIYQDDYAQETSAWIRLQNYCKTFNLKPVHFTLEYVDNVVDILPPNADGYFFRRGFINQMMLSANANETTPFAGNRAKSFLIGYFGKTTDLLHVYTFKIPEFDLWEIETRDKDQRFLTKVHVGNSLFMVD